MANPRIDVEIGAKIDNLKSALLDAEGSLQKFGKNATALGKVLSLAVTAPLLAIGVAAVKTASDFEETASKFNTVFRDVQKSADDAFTSLRDSYGLSSLASKQLLSDTGDLLTGFGFGQKAALDLSLEVNKLAVDLASFTNFAGGAEGASQALTKALLGERESVKALGISILEEDVKKQVAINTAKGLIFETERQAKAQATLDIALQQSTNAIGDYAKTKDGLANQTRLLQERIQDLSVSFGQVLLPITNKIVTGINELVQGFLSLDKETRETIVIIAGITAAIGPLLIGIGTVIKALPLLAAGFTALSGPIGIIGIAVVGLGVLVATNFDQIVFNTKVMTLEFVDGALKIAKAVNLLSGIIPGLSGVSQGAILILENFGKSVSESIISGLGVEGVKAVDDFKDSLDSVSTTTTNTKQSFEDFSKVADDLNKKFFLDGAENARLFNEQLAETNRLTASIESGAGNILAGQLKDESIANQGGIQRIDIGLPDGPLVPDIPDEIVEETKAKLLDLSSAYAALGTQIANSLNIGSDALRGFVSTLLSNTPKIITAIFQQVAAKKAASLISSQASQTEAAGEGIAVAAKAANALGPIGLALLPVFIGGALALISGAFGKGGGRGSRGGGGGVGASSGASSQSFGGTGISDFVADRSLSGELVVRGQDLVYVFGQASNKMAKG